MPFLLGGGGRVEKKLIWEMRLETDVELWMGVVLEEAEERCMHALRPKAERNILF